VCSVLCDRLRTRWPKHNKFCRRKSFVAIQTFHGQHTLEQIGHDAIQAYITWRMIRSWDCANCCRSYLDKQSISEWLFSHTFTFLPRSASGFNMTTMISSDIHLKISAFVNSNVCTVALSPGRLPEQAFSSAVGLGKVRYWKRVRFRSDSYIWTLGSRSPNPLSPFRPQRREHVRNGNGITIHHHQVHLWWEQHASTPELASMRVSKVSKETDSEIWFRVPVKFGEGNRLRWVDAR
jgi:hypothetical protein